MKRSQLTYISSVNEKTVDDIKLKQTKNLFHPIIKYGHSIFYSVHKINRNLIDKARKSIYSKDRIELKGKNN